MNETNQTRKIEQSRLDSLMQLQVIAALTRQAVSEGETVVDLVVYDTNKPIIDSTGRFPIQAVLHQEHRQKWRSDETVQADILSEKQIVDDAYKEIEAQTSVISTEEKKTRTGMGIMRIGIDSLLLAMVAFAIWIIYKRIKF